MTDILDLYKAFRAQDDALSSRCLEGEEGEDGQTSQPSSNESNWKSQTKGWFRPRIGVMVEELTCKRTKVKKVGMGSS